jgi:uncharacterized membrane protein
MSDFNDPLDELPLHIGEAIRSIAQFHADHHRKATRSQRVIDQTIAFIASMKALLVLSVFSAAWIGLNLLAAKYKFFAVDPPPFSGLGTFASLISLYLVILILATQRRENQLTQQRDQLTLELAIINEQKTAKTIQLLEELRRDTPQIRDRADQEALDMAQPADPQSVLRAINKTHAEAEQIL